jgi:hypothetical protein
MDPTDKPLKVAIFDDVLAARREVFHIPGLEIGVYGHADDVQNVCYTLKPDVLCMDYAMGEGHATGEEAIRAVRAMGFAGRIVAMSSDPAANQRMIDAGANESLQQKAMLRSYLVALGVKRAGEGGLAALPVVFGLGAVAAWLFAVALVGPHGWQSRYRGDYVRLYARVAPQGAASSPIDGAPSPAEAVSVWGAKGKTFEKVAGDDSLADARFAVAAEGRLWTVVAAPTTVWHLTAGPSRRLFAPADVPVGAGLPGFRDVRYVARSTRVTEGEYLWLVGFVHDQQHEGAPPERQLLVTDVADDAHRARLGVDLEVRPLHHASGLALLVVGAALLAGAGRA